MLPAHHWRQAGDAERETDYAYRAGMLALQSGACREAVEHLSRALVLLKISAQPAPASPGRSARAHRARSRQPRESTIAWCGRSRCLAGRPT